MILSPVDPAVTRPVRCLTPPARTGYGCRMPRPWPLLLPLALLAACGEKEGTTDADTNTSTDATTGPDTLTPTSEPTGGDDPSAEGVCMAACAKFSECGSDSETCESDCLAGIEFLAMNNPGTDCGEIEKGRQDCLSQLTCDELDAYINNPDDPMRPCKEWIDMLDKCAIE